MTSKSEPGVDAESALHVRQSEDGGQIVEGPLLRVQDAARILQVSKWTIYRWIEEGRLRATKIGRGSLRIFRASVNGLIDGRCTDQESQESDGQGKEARVRSSLRASKERG